MRLCCIDFETGACHVGKVGGSEALSDPLTSSSQVLRSQAYIMTPISCSVIKLNNISASSFVFGALSTSEDLEEIKEEGH